MDRMAALVMAEYAEAFDNPTASAMPVGGMRGGVLNGGFRGIGGGGGFVRAGGTKAVYAGLMRRGFPCDSGSSRTTSQRPRSYGIFESKSKSSRNPDSSLQPRPPPPRDPSPPPSAISKPKGKRAMDQFLQEIKRYVVKLIPS